MVKWQSRARPLVQPLLSLSDWRVAVGRVDAVSQAAWRDERCAIAAPLAVSPTGRFVVAGEYWLANGLELARSLPIAVAQFGLAELAQLWEQQGRAMWGQLVGGFALVVWDREQQVLHLGRDRSGIRTLYYTTTGATQWVAPRLRSLRPYHSDALDLVALRDYLCCAFVPGERTLWQQVREVRPGTVVQLPSAQQYSYWTLQEQVTAEEQPLAWHGARLRSQLERVVTEHLPAGEAVGVFLSGGLDSSAVTALASRLHDAPVHTYSLHFGPDCPNELEFSALVAAHCQTHHHVLEISLRELWQRLPETMQVLDDPMGDPLTVPNWLLGRLASQTVAVVLNGEGGDPCFGGPKNQPMLLNRLYQEVGQPDLVQAFLASFQKCAPELAVLLRSQVWQQVQAVPSVFEPLLRSQANYLNRLMLLNIAFKGADQILTKVNNLMGAAGVEGRSPLFDQRIVAQSLQIPPQYKLSGVEEKAVLKQAVADCLPAAILQRPKSGMMVPVQLGFRQYWNRAARSLLLSRRAAIAPYLNQSLIRDWLNYQGDPWGRYGVKLWLLASLEYWLQGNGLKP